MASSRFVCQVYYTHDVPMFNLNVGSLDSEMTMLEWWQLKHVFFSGKQSSFADKQTGTMIPVQTVVMTALDWDL